MDFNNWNVTWGLSFGLAAFMITAGNILTIVIFLRQKLRKRPHFLLISLAVADLLVGLITVPLYIKLNSEQGVGIFLPYLFADIFTGFTSIFTLVAISLERMYAVGWPFRHRLLTSKHYVSAIGMPWALALAVLMIRMLFDLKVIASKDLKVVMTIALFTPLLVVCGAYYVIWKKQDTRISNHMRANRATANLTKTLLIVTVAFIATWLPFQVLNTVITFCGFPCSKHPKGVVYLIKLLQFSNSALNVVIYPVGILEFRDTFREILPSCKNSTRNRQDTTCLEPWTLQASHSEVRSLSQAETAV